MHRVYLAFATIDHYLGSMRFGGCRWVLIGVISFGLNLGLAGQTGFDHTHARWDALLKLHVTVSGDGSASGVDYAGFGRSRTDLRVYLSNLSAVTLTEYESWSRAQRLAFLINAYNAFTVELILSRYPNLRSIRELGTLFVSPWRIPFFRLLGRDMTLDGIEHDLIRAPGSFNDPRIHAAVNCAAIGCPMLRFEAYRADRLDAQLEDSMSRFLRDSSRNRFDAPSRTLLVSRIFDWYRIDFERGWLGFTNLANAIGRWSNALGLDASALADLQRGRIAIRFLDYDWGLNAVAR